MAKDLLGYKDLMLDAMRRLFAKVLKRVAEEGLPGDHHLYITFGTTHPGVDIPDALLARYPDEMTIVLQHKFWGLEVDDNGFGVTLSFNRQGQRLYVPFAAVTSFVDPAAQFGLQFESDGEPLETAGRKAEERESTVTGNEAESEAPSEEKVVALDTFRKK